MRQTVFWLFAFLFLMIKCPSPCGREFATDRGLKQHQQSCRVYLAEEFVSAASPIDSLARYEAKRARKRQKRTHPGPNTTLPHIEHPPEPHESTVGFSGATSLDDTAMMFDDTIEPIPPVEPPRNAAGHIIRQRRKTWKLLQNIPEPPTPLPNVEPSDSDSDGTPPPSVPAFAWKTVHTSTNSFGLYREYPAIPTHNPDDLLTLSDLTDLTRPPTTIDITPPNISRLAPSIPDDASRTTSTYYPFANSTIFGLMNWMWTGSALKSIGEMAKLILFLKSDKFEQSDLMGFDIQRETTKFDTYLAGSSSTTANSKPSPPISDSAPGIPSDGWHEIDVNIQVPDGKPHKPEDIPTFTVTGLHRRSIVEVIKNIFQDATARRFHYTPFKTFWRSEGAVPERVYDELYSSDAMINTYTALQNNPPEEGCTLERVVVSLMFWSDSTHLANFGSASLWPLYLFFGNQSKWTRGKPRSAACHHVAYIPKLPDNFHDFFYDLTGEGPSADVLSHCRRELMHKVWETLLDAEFLHAYKHGIVIECPDTISRRFYPRIFTYSADYPEKVLLATIQNLGACPCPRCLIAKKRIPELGTKLGKKRRTETHRVDTSDHHSKIAMVRKWIYEEGHGVKSAAVERVLAPQSLVPTVNAFSILSTFGFNIHKALTVDFMHEFELGVWKSFFTHLIRILVAHGGTSVQDFNRRYRNVPTFGRSTIRRFSDNASAMKKLAARNFEDFLQCAIPVFEGLLPAPHNNDVLSLLFTFAEWHALGKLRLHTEFTLTLLDQATTQIGKQLRRFQSYTCSFFATKPLPKEEATRGRRKARAQSGSGATGEQGDAGSKVARGRGRGRGRGRPGPQARGHGRGRGVGVASTSDASTTPEVPRQSAKSALFNLVTYKLHALGDYVRTIRLFGTSDSYSTQPGELEHRRVKRFYVRTNKNRATRQMTRLERRERALLRLAAKQHKNLVTKSTTLSDTTKHTGLKPNHPHLDFSESEALPYTSPEQHHHISSSRNFPVNLSTFLAEARGDQAVEGFMPKLQEHILSRLTHPEWSGDGNEFTPEERRKINVLHNRFYRHKVLRVNYTTYDVRRGQDSMNPRTNSHIMMLARNDDAAHPFEYARIIGIFHVDVVHNAPGASSIPTSMNILWIRRFAYDPRHRAGFRQKRLHRIQFLHHSKPDAFGFLNPDEVIRGAHLIPVFCHGATEEFLQGESLARMPGEIDDWLYYYVNIFVDRDMYMRYVGGGVGHYRVNLDDPHDIENEDDDDLNPTAGLGDMVSGGSGSDDGHGGVDSSSGSGHSDLELSESSSSDNSDDMGAEDGEGGFIDEEDEEGYAPL